MEQWRNNRHPENCKMNALTGREQRLIAIAILIALVAIAWLGIARPLISGFSERAEERQRLIAIHQRNEMLVERAPTWRRQLPQQKRDGAGFPIPAQSGTASGRERVGQYRQISGVASP